MRIRAGHSAPCAWTACEGFPWAATYAVFCPCPPLTQLAASKRLRALAGLALKNGSEGGDQASGAEEEDEEEEDDGSSSRSAKAPRSSGVVSPRTATIATTAADGSGPTSRGRRHLTRAATGSLKRRSFGDDMEVELGGSEEDEEAATAATVAMQAKQRRFAQQMTAAAATLAAAANQVEQTVAGGWPGSRDSSKDTRSTHTAEHVHAANGDELPVLMQRESAAFARVMSATASNGELCGAAAWCVQAVEPISSTGLWQLAR